MNIMSDAETKLERMVTRLERKLDSQRKKIEDLEHRVNIVTPTDLKLMIEEIKKDGSELHKFLGLLIHKATVCTEIAYWDRGNTMAHKVLRAYDFEDDYWIRRKHFTMGQWREEIRNINILSLV